MLLLLFLPSIEGVQNPPPAHYVQMPAAVTVQEGLCITILCTFHHPPTPSSPAHGYWFEEGSQINEVQPVATNDPMREVQEEFRGRFHLIGDPLKNNCTLRITDARKEDSRNYFFRIERGQERFSYVNYQLALKVTDLTEKPVIYSPETLEEGQLVTLVCLAPWICREGTPLTFSWTGAAVPSLQLSPNFSYFSGLSFVPKLQDHGSNLTCGMTFPGASGRALLERTIQLNVTSKTKPDFFTFTTGTLLGSGVTAFLAFCLILTCVKFLRKKKWSEDREVQDRKEANCSNQVPGVPLDQQRDSRPPSPDPTTQSSSGELYYATINFGRPKSVDPLLHHNHNSPHWNCDPDMLLLLLLLLLLSLGGSQFQNKGYIMEVSPTQTVQEGLCIYISCTVIYPHSWFGTIFGYWYRETSGHYYEHDLVATNNKGRAVEKDAEGRFHLVGDVMKNNCSLSITDVQKKDSGQYYFRIEKWNDGFNYINHKVNLNVKALTEKPDIYSPGILEPAHPVTLICAAPWVCGNGTPPIFSWIGALSNLTHRQRTPHFSELILTPRPQDHGAKLICQMYFPATGVQTETTVSLNVAYPLKNFGVRFDWENGKGSESTSNFSVLKDESLQLRCEAESNPPAILSWTHEGRVVLSSWPTRDGILVLRLTRLGIKDGGEYSCQAQYRMDTQNASLNLSVLYAPENLKISVLEPNRTVAILGNTSSLVVLVGESLQLECAADSNPPAKMNWAKGSQPLNSSLLSSPGILCLELANIQPEDGGEYTCHAQNIWGTQHISVNLFVQYPPRLFNPFCSWADEGLLCTCSVQAEPTPSLIWWVGEKTVEVDGNDDILQVMSSTSGAWTNSSLILREKWDLDLSLCCEGRNQHGANSLVVLMVSDRTSAVALAFSKGAFLGVGIMILLILCLMLAYKKFLRKKQTETEKLGTAKLGTADSQSNEEMDYVNLDKGTVPRRPAPDPGTQSQPEELHYASINFRRLNQKTQPEAHTEYSEIKF
ncbi:sialic acid-binding Ig-like lectin 10 [Sarcophilus harrisii]